jgi:hypothetical protein
VDAAIRNGVLVTDLCTGTFGEKAEMHPIATSIAMIHKLSFNMMNRLILFFQLLG